MGSVESMGSDTIDAISDSVVLTRALVIFLATIFMFAGNFKRFRFLLLLADFLCREWVFRYGLLARDIGLLGHISLLIRRLSGFIHISADVKILQPAPN